MNILEKIDRYMGVRACVGMKKIDLSEELPLIFLGGMSRTGNHLMHSLLDGHKELAAIPEEDFFLRTNIGSLSKQLILKYYICSHDKESTVDLLLKYNKTDNWLGVVNGVTVEHNVDFSLIDYDKYKNALYSVISGKNKSLCEVYNGYINSLLRSVPGYDEKNAKWRLYFNGNADFLTEPIMKWDIRNKVIVPLRDPLQRFASHKKWEHSDFICTPDRILAWEKVHRSYEKFMNRYKDRLLLVDYTQLVNDVDGVMRNVSKFLNIEYDDMLTRPTVLGRSVSGNTSFKERGEREGQIYKKSLEQYKDILSDKEINIIKKNLSPIYMSLNEKADEFNG